MLVYVVYAADNWGIGTTWNKNGGSNNLWPTKNNPPLQDAEMFFFWGGCSFIRCELLIWRRWDTVPVQKWGIPGEKENYDHWSSPKFLASLIWTTHSMVPTYVRTIWYENRYSPCFPLLWRDSSCLYYRPKLLKFLDFPRFPGHTKDYIHTSLGTVILGLQLAPLSLHKSITGVTFNLQDGLDSLSEVWPGRKHFRDRWRMTSMIFSTFYPPQIGEHIL